MKVLRKIKDFIIALLSLVCMFSHILIMYRMKVFLEDNPWVSDISIDFVGGSFFCATYLFSLLSVTAIFIVSTCNILTNRFKLTMKNQAVAMLSLVSLFVYMVSIYNMGIFVDAVGTSHAVIFGNALLGFITLFMMAIVFFVSLLSMLLKALAKALAKELLIEKEH